MKRLPSNRPESKNGRSGAKAKIGKVENHPETQALMRNLDKVCERLRKRARAEWLRSHPGEDPSDACVSVRIDCGNGESFTLTDNIR